MRPLHANAQEFDRGIASPRSGAALHDQLYLLRWCLWALIAVGAMIPWYTLRLFPIVAVGTAKINLLDALVAAAVILAAPRIAHEFRRGPREAWWVCAFLAYMAIPLAAGILDPSAEFFAVREAQPLAFYTLAVIFVWAGFKTSDFQRFAGVYVAGTVAAIVAVFAHVRWLLPLPGYPERIVNPGQFTTAWLGVKYLEWTVPVVAFIFSLTSALAARSLRWRVIWTTASLIVAWYALATTERFMQVLIVGIAVVVTFLPAFGGRSFRRLALIVAAVMIAGVLGFGAVRGPSWLSHPATVTVLRWSQWASDNSLRFRLTEFVGGLSRFSRHPLAGEGLGGVVLPRGPDPSSGPWRYDSSGYIFLLVKTGLIGFALYLAMVGTALRRGYRRLRAPRHQEPWPRTVIGLIGLGALLVLNLLYPTVDTPEGAIAFSLFYGMVVSEDTPQP
jgi:O-antigen ligase